jgi:hypothetical protein
MEKALQEDEQKGKTLGVSFHTKTDELIYKIHSMASTWDTSIPETKCSETAVSGNSGSQFPRIF